MNETPYNELPIGVSPQQLKRATTSWIIEAYHGSCRVYWNGHDPGNSAEIPYTRNPSDAVHFARERDAQSVLTHLLGGGGIVVPTPSTAAQPQKETSWENLKQTCRSTPQSKPCDTPMRTDVVSVRR